MTRLIGGLGTLLLICTGAVLLAQAVGGLQSSWILAYTTRDFGRTTWTIHLIDADRRLTIDLFPGIEFDTDSTYSSPSVSADRNIAAWSYQGAHLILARGSSTPVRSEAVTTQLHWSPVGARAAYIDFTSLNVVVRDLAASLASAPIRLRGADAGQIAWSAGGALAYSSDHGTRLNIVEAVETPGAPDPTPIVYSGRIVDLSWSRDESALAVLAWTGQYLRVSLYDRAARQTHRIRDFPQYDGGAISLSPDGANIALIAHSLERSSADLYLITVVDGAVHGPLARPPQGNRVALWSPDGSALAVVDSVIGRPEIYRINIQDGSRQRLTTNSRAEVLLP